MGNKVLIVQPISKIGEDYLTDKGYVLKKGSGTSECEIARDVADCDAMLVRNAKITPMIIDAGSRLKVIGRHGVGVDTINVSYALKKGVIVTNAPLSNANAVAEHTMHLLLSCAKHARKIDIAFRNGNFDIRHTVTNLELSGKTIGILGMGRIGQNVAKKAMYGFDMNVVAYDPFIKADMVDKNISLKRTLEEAVRDADFVTVHLPLNDETRGIIHHRFFAAMKPGSFLINAARGEVVNETDLLEALDSGHLAGGAFDLLNQEPPPAEHPLFGYENVILTPHNAAHTYEAFENMALHAAQGIHEVLSGNVPSWPVG